MNMLHLLKYKYSENYKCDILLQLNITFLL